MLEDLALQYSVVAEDNMRLIGYGLWILGGIIGGLSYSSTTEIRRAHYFALLGQIFLSIGVVTLGYMAFIVQALAGGFFWVIVAAEILVSVAGGFLIARIAADRSRDAYGHGRAAALAFIPFANFWLLLTPSKNEMSVHRAPAIPLLTGGLGVLSGFVMLGAGISLSAYAQADGKRRVEEATAAGLFDEVMLERTLVMIADAVQTPLAVDETTSLVRIEAVGQQLQYVYEVDGDVVFLPADMRLRLTQQNCAIKELTSVIDAGAVLRHVYLRRDSSEIGVVEVTREACGR